MHVSHKWRYGLVAVSNRMFCTWNVLEGVIGHDCTGRAPGTFYVHIQNTFHPSIRKAFLRKLPAH